MPDMLNLDEGKLAALMPEQRLMAAIIRRAVADLPISRRFFETDNGMFRLWLCCEALNLNPNEVSTGIAKKLKANKTWRFSAASAI